MKQIFVVEHEDKGDDDTIAFDEKDIEANLSAYETQHLEVYELRWQSPEEIELVRERFYAFKDRGNNGPFLGWWDGRQINSCEDGYFTHTPDKISKIMPLPEIDDD